MERLVVTVQITDDCTYSCDDVIPFEYESAEAFLVNLETAIKAAVAKVDAKKMMWVNGEFVAGGKTFDINSFVYHVAEQKSYFEIVLPDVFTLDEWFEEMK